MAKIYGTNDLDIFKQMLLKRQGGSASLDDMENQDKMHDDAINTASGVLGSVKAPSFRKTLGIVDESIPMAERIKAAAQNSKVKLVPTKDDILREAEIERLKNLPKTFFDDVKKRATQKLEVPSNNDERFYQILKALKNE